MTTSPQVLIAGAGPTGLAQALVLAKLGVSVRIIDKNFARSDKSKALGVQAGTLECLESAIGGEIVETMIRAGCPTQGAWIHLNDSEPLRVDLSTIPSKHNFILILEQSETERILEEELGKFNVKVERQTELLQATDDGSKVISKIKHGNGAEEEIEASFLIGCDGAHSTVRRSIATPFVGEAYTGDFILADVTVNWPWPCGVVHTFVTKRGVIASFPMRELVKDKPRYRLILIQKEPGAETQEISEAEFKTVLAELSLGKIDVTEITWLTRFRVHHRMVEHFQKGRIFLAGDAAHIHSPAGGQGMNTGIQDAFNLGHKIKKVISGERPIATLEAYERERMPIARNVLRSTDLVFKMALFPEWGVVGFARQFLLPKIVKSRFIQRRVAKAISEVTVARREIAHYSS